MSYSKLKALKHPWNSSVVKAELDPWCRPFAQVDLKTKMLLVLSHAADMQLAWYLLLEAGNHETMIWTGRRTPGLPVPLAVAPMTHWIRTSPSAIPGSTTAGEWNGSCWVHGKSHITSYLRCTHHEVQGMLPNKSSEDLEIKTLKSFSTSLLLRTLIN